MSKLFSIHFNAEADVAEAAFDGLGLLKKPVDLAPMLSMPRSALRKEASDARIDAADSVVSGWSSEAAARTYLQTLLQNQNSERLAEVTSPERPEAVPNMKLERNEEMPLTGTQSVAFQQTAFSLPVFGTRAVVEIDAQSRRLHAVDGLISYVPDIPAMPELGMKEGADRLAALLGKETAALDLKEPPTLCFYPQPEDPVPSPAGEQPVRWKLAYHFHKVPVEPARQEGAPDFGCCGESTPFGPVPHDYLVDANDGSLLLVYPSATFLDVPVACTGTDINGNTVSFDGLQLNTTTFEMTDPLRSIQTLDAGFADIALNTSSATNVRHSSTDFPASTAAATTAHTFSSQVFDFFNHVLKRKSMDNKGMQLISIVNCYYSKKNNLASPGWRNAMWFNGRMWYGSTLDASNNPVTTARFLDIMAHELAHGVTETTANLIYNGQSGALNESFSDIFGIFIKNWYPGEPNPLSGWSWTLGDGWRGDGTVLRDCIDPTLGGAVLGPNGPGQPAHMNDYVVTPYDNGGVHINSGIHNRAFYNVMQSKDAGGSPLFTPAEAAVLYYVTLTRLAPSSTFSDCRRTLLNVTTQRYQGQPAAQKEKLDAIKAAYAAVGIL